MPGFMDQASQGASQSPEQPQEEAMIEKKRNQLAIESGEELEPEDDMTMENDDFDIPPEEIDVKMKQALGDDDYNLLMMYMTPEFNGLMKSLWGSMLPTPVEKYFTSKTNQNMILIPMDRSKVTKQIQQADMARANPANAKTNSKSEVKGSMPGTERKESMQPMKPTPVKKA